MPPDIHRIVPDAVRKRYVAKFGLVMVVVLLLTIAVAGVFYADITEQINADARSDMEDTTRYEAAMLADWIATNERTVDRLAAHDGMNSSGDWVIEATLAREYERMAADDEAIEAIHYVDLDDDEVLYSTSDDGAGTNLADLDLELYVEDGSSISKVGYEELDADEFETAYTDSYAHDGQQLIAFLSPVTNRDEQTAVMATFRASELAAGFDEPIEGSSTRVLELDDGEIVVAEDGGQIGTEYRGGDSLVRETVQSEPRTTEYDETDELIAYARIPNTNWALVSHAPQSNAYALTDSVATSLIALIALTLTGFLAMSVTIGRSTAASLQQLANDAQTLSRGEVDVEFADTDRIDEVGQVRDSFDDIRRYLETASNQAEAIARQDFDDPLLDEAVPGTLGASLDTMHADLEEYIDELETLADRLRRKADEFGVVMSQAADGDLTVRMDLDSENEAMADIAAEFNETLEEFEAAVAQLATFAHDVAEKSEEVTASSEEVQAASQRIATSIQEISDGADRQHESLRQVDRELNDLSTTTEEIAASSNEVATLAERTAGTGRDGREAATDAIEGVDRLEEERRSVVAEFERLRTEVEQIDELADRIAEIAEQTNMLALNANIEASRSASADTADGFGVVASEVKELSTDAKAAAESIGDRIDGIQQQTDRAADEVERTSEEIERVDELVRNAAAALDEIAEYAHDTNVGVQDISAATQQQAAATQEIVAMVDEVAAISEQTTSEAEGVAAAAEEQTAALTNVTEAADQLSRQAVTLSTSLEEFETDVETGATRRASPADVTDPAESETGATESKTGNSDDSSAGESEGRKSEPSAESEQPFTFPGDRDDR